MLYLEFVTSFIEQTALLEIIQPFLYKTNYIDNLGYITNQCQLCFVI